MTLPSAITRFVVHGFSSRAVRIGHLAILLALAAGCRRDMFSQPKLDPLGKSTFFQNDAASQPIPAHTIARGDFETNDLFFSGMEGTNLVTDFPLPVTAELLQRGRQRYEIYCLPCHGVTGDGHGIVVERGFPAPPSYHIDRLRKAPAGHFFEVITHGYGVMYSYAQRVAPTDRWAIAAYIQALQLSQHAALADVPTNEMARLENSPGGTK
jgi:mono/diheme cytochrome c family protein